ncbi:MAG: ATP-dependent DNA helicase RecG [Clostridiales bacterium]|nr:ATP-dependent DNA helicase RecG [Clostridiales bacterium]
MKNNGVIDLKSVGAAREAVLNKLDIYTVRDLLEHFPRGYDDRSRITRISDLTPNVLNTVRAVINTEAENVFSGARCVVRLRIKDETGTLLIVWFNQPYLTHVFKKRDEYIFTGVVKEIRSFSTLITLEMRSPEYEKWNEGKALSGGRIVPVYSSTGKLGQKTLRSLIHSALQSADYIEEFLPQDILLMHRLCGRDHAVRSIHFPESDEDFLTARRRLVFDELLCGQLAILHIKGKVKRQKGVILKNSRADPFLQSLPFSFTASQRKSLTDILNDMSDGYVMNRLVQGDVGSGKTAVAMAAAYAVIDGGFQAAIMAPTEVLARQHYNSFSGAFEPLGILTELAAGSLTASERKRAYKRIESGEAQMVVGTHALIQEKLSFSRLGLVITDEQHRFGVNQRFLLSQKGDAPHVLVMTATPIPRTLALILYGDLDISTIDELPPGRQPVDTFFVSSGYRARIRGFIRKQLEAGRQAYVVCSMIDESEEKVIRAVNEYAAELSEALPGFKTACLHGKLKAEEKQRVLEDFSQNNINVIVSTTVIEVGINVPNATVMLIENADRHGLAALHQLRGRIGRGAFKSYCILISDTRSKMALQKLKALAKTNDGFALSDLDLKLRGAGDFFGVRQHGLPEFKIADLYKDMDILKEAQEAANTLYGRESESLKREISRIFKFNEEHPIPL